jgi:hypothetical protein
VDWPQCHSRWHPVSLSHLVRLQALHTQVIRVRVVGTLEVELPTKTLFKLGWMHSDEANTRA